MALDNINVAYDIEQLGEYDTHQKPNAKSAARDKGKAKRDNLKVVQFPTKSHGKVDEHKAKYKRAASIITVSALILICLIANISGRVALTEVNQKITSATRELAQQESIYTQNKLKLDTKYSTVVVEEYAKKYLNMGRSTNYQKEFINLSEGDKAEIVQIEEQNIFEKMFDSIKALLS